MKKLLALPALLLFVIPPLESQQITGKATLNVGTATGAGHYDGTVKVCGGSFCNSSGQKLHLVGPNIFGELGRQTPCTNLRGGDEPSLAQAIADVPYIAAWKANIIRIGVDEDCWLDINGMVNGGAAYQTSVQNYVTAAHASNMYVILTLFTAAPGTNQSGTVGSSGSPMADRDHATAYWASVAGFFKNDPGVMFDLYNEPHGFVDWNCWLNGGCNLGFVVEGMQEMLTAVRNAGALDQPVLLGVLSYDHDTSQFLTHLPSDPSNAFALEFHQYNTASNLDYASLLAATQAANIPILEGELGEYNSCGSTYDPPIMTWNDQHNVNYLPWVWYTGTCGPPGQASALITDYSGTPTQPYGAAVKAHLQALNP